jgi:hypothetical protein
LPGDVYIKSFLRSYCRYLDLNEKEYIDCFKMEYGAEPQQEPQQITREIELPVSPHRKTGFIFGVLAVILLFGTSYIYREYIVPSMESKEPQVVEEDNPLEEPPQVEDIPEPPQPEAINIYFKCLGECWIQVKDAEGKRLYEGTMVKDQEMSFDNLQKVAFTLGNAGQMQIMINGEDLGVLGKYVVKKTYIFENNEVIDTDTQKKEQPDIKQEEKGSAQQNPPEQQEEQEQDQPEQQEEQEQDQPEQQEEQEQDQPEQQEEQQEQEQPDQPEQPEESV